MPVGVFKAQPLSADATLRYGDQGFTLLGTIVEFAARARWGLRGDPRG